MEFGIADLLWTTTAAALLFALLSRGVVGFVIAFLVLNLLQIVIPIGTLFAIIVFADQRDQMLDFATLPGWKVLKKIWILSIVCTIIVWGLLFSSVV